MVHIHDKTPEGRRKLKEGPKAQEKYLEELMSEWVDNHTLNTQEEDQDPVPQHIQDRYALLEEETRQKILKRDYEAVVASAVEEAQAVISQRRAAAERGNVLMRRAAQDLQMYGRVRESTLKEIESVADILGIPHEEILNPEFQARGTIEGVEEV